MANNDLIVTAGLNFDASEALIVNQLKQIQDNFNNEGGLQINCKVSDESLRAIQNSLDNLTQNLDVKVDAQNIQQSVNQAVKAEPIRINVQPQIDSGAIKRQAKELKEIWGINFAGESKETIAQLNTQLQEMLSNYDKAKKAGNFNDMMSSWERLSEFVNLYSGSIKNLTPEMEHINSVMQKTKVLITASDYEELEAIYKTKAEIQKVLNDTLGVGKWSYKPWKASYGFDSLVNELNSRLYGDSSTDKITESIVEGLRQISALRHADTQEAREWERYQEEILSQDENAWEHYKNAVLDTLYKIRGEESPALQGFIDIISDEEIQKNERNVETYKKGMETIANLKAEYLSQSNVNSVTADWTQDAARNLEGFVLNIQKVNGEVEHLYYELNETGDAFEQFKIKGSDSGVEKMLVKAVNAASTLERQIINLKSAADDASAPRPITSEESIQKVTEAYNKAENAIQKLRTADAATFQELDNEAKKAVDELNNVIKAARNADTAATKLRAKPIETIKAEETANLNKFVATISNSAVPSVENLIQRIEALKIELGEVKDKQGLTDYLNRLTTIESDFKALETQAKAVKKAISDLDKLSGSTQFRNNAGNQDVTAQVSKITALRNEYNALLNSLSQAKTPESIQAISNKLAELKPRFDAVVESSNALNNALKDNDASAKFGAKLNQLKNQVDIFANTNRKATESLRLMRDGQTTFAQGWQNIRDALNNGSLDAAGLQRLREQFQNFRGEADAAGLTVSRFFQSMQSQLRMVLQRWISLYAVIGYIRKMIDNVKELDNAMINLRRVTDETDAGYQRFLEDANKLARQMKTTTSSLVEMSYQWSKLGFEMNEALDLSKASTVFMRVADVEQDQALSNLVTSLKAFRLEASQTMDVVDKLDKLNNEYAVSAAGLGDGLERSASAMAMTGNSLEETLAMLTGAGEITQNLENTGNAIRVISLR